MVMHLLWSSKVLMALLQCVSYPAVHRVLLTGSSSHHAWHKILACYQIASLTQISTIMAQTSDIAAFGRLVREDVRMVNARTLCKQLFAFLGVLPSMSLPVPACPSHNLHVDTSEDLHPLPVVPL